MRSFFLSTSALLTLSTILATPAADAQDYACAVPAHTEQPGAEDARGQLHRFATGAGVRVAVIDTGVAAHPELDQLVAGRDFVDAAAPDALVDCDSHGTVVAGIIAGTSHGVAPGAEILSIRQTSAHYRNRDTAAGGDTGGDAATAGSLLTLADAIHHALDERARVVNVSVVSCLPPDLAQRVDMAPIHGALARAEAEGAVVVAAGGNTSQDCADGHTVVPAHADTVIAVGAREDSHTMAPYSVAAPGAFVSASGSVSAALASDGQGWAAGTRGPRGETQPYMGTSFAAPVVSGTVALLLERYPHLRPDQIRGLVYAAAEPHGGAVDPLTVVAQLPPEQLEHTTPLRVAPHKAETSSAPARWWVLATAALAFCCCVAVGGAAGNRLKHLR